MDENSYQIIITNSLSDDQDKHLVVQKLAALFKTSEEKAAQLLSKPETIVKKDINQATAEKYQTAILKTGAQCKIINTAIEDVLPEINHAATAPTNSSTSEHTAASFESAQNKKKQTKDQKEHQQLEQLDNFSDQSFCPQCGTIKDSVNTVCLHCGYDPKAPEIKNRKIRRVATIILGLTAVIIITYLVALPFYNLYATKSKIENGLGLAFDTRNTVTKLILDTGFWPNQNIDANLQKNISNDVIESVIISENSLITVTIRAQALKTETSKTIVFQPKMFKGKLLWNCTQGTLDNEFRPDICKHTGN